MGTRDLEAVWYSPAFGDACGKVPLKNMLFRIAALEHTDGGFIAHTGARVPWK
jgi:hypothetical protein